MACSLHHCFPWLAALSLAVFALGNHATAAEPAIRVLTDSRKVPTAFEAVGLSPAQLERAAQSPENGSSILAVFVVDDAAADLPAMVGDYSLQGKALRFVPRYPLRAGQKYRAVLQRDKSGSGAASAIVEDISIPAPPRSAPAKVTAVYPSSNVLPENQLKFYLHFSAPMSRGEAYRHITLLTGGKPVDLPFLEIGEELWDGSGQRLTLLMDPGRIKRGVKPREELGTALEAGKEYTLIIDRAWRDASGQPLAEGFKKTFKCTPPVGKAIESKEWKLTAPREGTREPISVRFPQPLDQALLERTISVQDATGTHVAGQIAISDEERHWELRPDLPWKAGKHHLVVDTVLEDLAGNRIGSPFEVDQLHPLDRTIEIKTARIPFDVSASK